MTLLEFRPEPAVTTVRVVLVDDLVGLDLGDGHRTLLSRSQRPR